MTRLGAFFRFWYDFVVGDDWRLAAAAASALLLSWVAVEASLAAWWVIPVVIVSFLTLVVLRDPT